MKKPRLNKKHCTSSYFSMYQTQVEVLIVLGEAVQHLHLVLHEL